MIASLSVGKPTQERAFQFSCVDGSNRVGPHLYARVRRVELALRDFGGDLRDESEVVNYPRVKRKRVAAQERGELDWLCLDRGNRERNLLPPRSPLCVSCNMR